MSKILVDTIDTRSGTSTLTIGSSNLTTLTKASGVTANFAGLKMADLWRQNTDTAISAATETFLTSNWEHTTTDNGTYDRAADGNSSIYHSNGFSISTSTFMFDVTNTSTHKCKFACICEFASDVGGNTGYNRTYARFLRLGDT
jgi:hypothetical protein